VPRRKKKKPTKINKKKKNQFNSFSTLLRREMANGVGMSKWGKLEICGGEWAIYAEEKNPSWRSGMDLAFLKDKGDEEGKGL